MGNQPSSATENPSAEPPNNDDTAPANVPPSPRLDTTQITRPQKKREGMALIQYRCRSSKAKYEKCVSDWYGNEFMKGDYANQEEACGDLFEMYKKCVLKGVRKEFWGNKKEKPKEGSFLSELEDDEE
jgi:hypothetical protein